MTDPDDATAIHIGSRVRMDESRVDGFIQPWRKRFKSGRIGTVVRGPSANVHGLMVEWDHRHTTNPGEWRLVHKPEELVLVSEAHD